MWGSSWCAGRGSEDEGSLLRAPQHVCAAKLEEGCHERDGARSGPSCGSERRPPLEVGAATSGLLHDNLGAVACPAQEPPSLVRRRWHRVNCGKDPEEVQVACRHRVERLESALQALGETDSTVNSALKEARRAAQGDLTVQVTECQGFIQRSQYHLRQKEEERVRNERHWTGLSRVCRGCAKRWRGIPIPRPT